MLFDIHNPIYVYETGIDIIRSLNICHLSQFDSIVIICSIESYLDHIILTTVFKLTWKDVSEPILQVIVLDVRHFVWGLGC